jgi:hypothetical protein
MSTRPVRIEGTDYITRVTREALDGMASQVAEGFIPITVEHLSYIPPIGRWHSADVIEAPDGECDLELRGTTLRQLVPVGDDPADVLLLVDGLPEVDPPTTDVHLQYEARNFTADDVAALQEAPPFPLKEGTQVVKPAAADLDAEHPCPLGRLQVRGVVLRDPRQRVR